MYDPDGKSVDRNFRGEGSECITKKNDARYIFAYLLYYDGEQT